MYRQLQKYILVILLAFFVASAGVVVLHHHDDKQPSDICQICDFAGIHYVAATQNIPAKVSFVFAALATLYIISYKYRLTGIYHNKAPPYATV